MYKLYCKQSQLNAGGVSIPIEMFMGLFKLEEIPKYIEARELDPTKCRIVRE